MTKSIFIAAALLLAAASHVQASEIAVTTDGSWHEFDVDDFTSTSGGLEWIDNITGPAGYAGDGSALTFTFTLGTAGILKVVDGGFGGDRFEVFDNGVSLGYTSVAPDSDPINKGTDFDSAYSDATWSSAVFNLSAGTHNITGALIRSALVDGLAINATVGAVSVAAVPVPAAWGLFMAGSALLGAISRRRSA